MTPVAKKIYFADLVPEHFLSEDINKTYSKKDYHRTIGHRQEYTTIRVQEIVVA